MYVFISPPFNQPPIQPLFIYEKFACTFFFVHPLFEMYALSISPYIHYCENKGTVFSAFLQLIGGLISRCTDGHLYLSSNNKEKLVISH